MAICAGEIREMRLTVTFQTKRSWAAADQEKSIWRSMRRMANVAPFELLCLVLKHPGASLIRVTFVADVGIEFIDLSQTRSCSTSMGCMAVGAGQCSLNDPMVVGEIKLGLHISMTGKTEIGVLLLQEILGGLLCVDLVAVVTSNCAQPVDPSPELKERLLFLVTVQADIRTVFRTLGLKREDEPFPFCLRMLVSRTMARFALFYPMGIFLKKVVNVRMAAFARLRPYIPFLLSLHLLLAKRGETDEGYQNTQCDTHNRHVLAPIHNRSPSLNIVVGILLENALLNPSPLNPKKGEGCDLKVLMDLQQSCDNRLRYDHQRAALPWVSPPVPSMNPAGSGHYRRHYGRVYSSPL